MPSLPPITTPAGYAPAMALGYADAQSRLRLVGAAAPLPVSLGSSMAVPPPLAGETSSSMLAGPFAAASGLAITVALDGTWSGTARLLRSTDGGAAMLPLRVGGTAWGVFDQPGIEQVWTETEQGAIFYLDIALTSGTLAYRVSQ